MRSSHLVIKHPEDHNALLDYDASAGEAEGRQAYVAPGRGNGKPPWATYETREEWGSGWEGMVRVRT